MLPVPLRQWTSTIVRVGSFVDKTDGITPETGVTLGVADQAVLLKPNGAAALDISGNTWAAITNADGWYNLTLTASNCDTVGPLRVVIQDASVCLPVEVSFQVFEEAIYDALYGEGAAGLATDLTSIDNSSLAAELLRQQLLEGPYAALSSAGYLDIAHVATVSGRSSTGISVTSSSATTTGATYGIAFVSGVSAIAASTVTDSKGNTWTKRNDLTNDWIRGAWYDCVNPTVGASHTLSTNAIGNSPAIFGLFFSGVRQATQIDQSASLNTGTGTTFATGGVTPTEDNEMIVAFAAIPSTNPAVPTIGSGFTESGFSSNSSGGNNVGGCAGYLLQTAAVESDPTFASNGGTVPAVCFLLSLLPQQDVPTITLTSFADGRIFQRKHGFDFATLSFGGTFSEGGDDVTPGSIEVIVYEHGTSNVVQGWTAVDNMDLDGSDWTGTLNVPQGGWYAFAARSVSKAGAVSATSVTTTAKTGVGVLVAIIGQSNGEKMFQNFTSLTANTKTRYYNGSWQANDGDGAIVLSDMLQQKTGLPIGLLRYAIAGTGLTADAGLGAGYWLNEAGGSPYALFEAGLTAVGGTCEYVIWAQGEADAYIVVSVATYKAGLATLYGRILAHTGLGRGQLKFGVRIMATLNDGTNQSCTDIRTALAQYGTEAEGAFISSNAIDATRVDNYHYDGASYQRLGRHDAQSILHQMGIEPFGGAGPRIVEAKVIGQDVWLRAEHMSGGTALVGGSPAGEGLTGFEVSDDAFATTLTISSTWISGNNVVLRLSAEPAESDTIVVRHLYGKLPTITTLVRDDVYVLNDTTGCPLIPFDSLEARVATDVEATSITLTEAEASDIADAIVDQISPVSAANVDAEHTWAFQNATQLTAPNLLRENIGFAGLVQMDFTEAMPERSSISSISSATFTNLDGTEPTVSASAKSTDGKKALITIATALATVNTHTLTVTIVTTDSQTIVRKGQIILA